MAFAFAWLSGLGFRVACKTSAVIGTLTPCRVLGVAGCRVQTLSLKPQNFPGSGFGA